MAHLTGMKEKFEKIPFDSELPRSLFALVLASTGLHP